MQEVHDPLTPQGEKIPFQADPARPSRNHRSKPEPQELKLCLGCSLPLPVPFHSQDCCQLYSAGLPMEPVYQFLSLLVPLVSGENGLLLGAWGLTHHSFRGRCGFRG